MNHSGEPGHDDYGLPRVDIQIPDDARELDRDVQAYHRELRALRRHERSLRWRTPLRRSGMTVPLIAGCLVLAMVAGMVLTMFSANPYFNALSGQRPPGPSARNSAPAGTRTNSSSAAPSATRNPSGGPGTGVAAHLPAGNITVGGQLVSLSSVAGAALAIIPVNCGCAVVVRRLVSQAMAAGVIVYLVGTGSNKSELGRLAPDRAIGTAYVAIDADSVLNKAYQPAGATPPAQGITVVLVDSQHNVRGAKALAPGFHLESQLRLLRETP